MPLSLAANVCGALAARAAALAAFADSWLGLSLCADAIAAQLGAPAMELLLRVALDGLVLLVWGWVALPRALSRWDYRQSRAVEPSIARCEAECAAMRQMLAAMERRLSKGGGARAPAVFVQATNGDDGNSGLASGAPVPKGSSG